MVAPKLAFMAAASILQGVQGKIAGDQAMDSAESEASAIRQSAVTNEKLRKIKTRKILGRQIAEAGQGGSFTGSDIEVLAQSVIEDELEGDINIFNSEVNAIDVLNRGAVAQQRGNQGLFGSIVGAGTKYFVGKELLSKFDDVRVTSPREAKAILRETFPTQDIGDDPFSSVFGTRGKRRLE